jgi:hypothetical protein
VLSASDEEQFMSASNGAEEKVVHWSKWQPTVVGHGMSGIMSKKGKERHKKCNGLSMNNTLVSMLPLSSYEDKSTNEHMFSEGLS